MSRFLLSAAAAGGADAPSLARDARVPGWALGLDQAMLPYRYSQRLWELLEHALDDPYVALTVVSRHKLGELDLYDYLFTTAATLKDGLATSSRYMHLLSTNGLLEIDASSDREITYSYRYLDEGGRGGELGRQFTIAGFCARARAGTGRPVMPVHVGFSQPAPRTHRGFVEAFGTAEVDFGVPADTATFRACDLDVPMRGADPVLARLLNRYAATLTPPPPATWREHFRTLLGEAIDGGEPSLDALARRMAVSRRSLQRRLAEEDTTWRAELDTIRWQRAQATPRTGAPDTAALARKLGYSDARSVRRALRRWQNSTHSSPP